MRFNFLEKYKRDFDAIPARKKAAIKVFGTIGIVILLLIMLKGFSDDNNVDRKADTDNSIKLREDNYVKEKWLGEAERNMRTMEKRIKELEGRLQKQGGLIEKQKSDRFSKPSKDKGSDQDILAQIKDRIKSAPVKKPNWDNLELPQNVEGENTVEQYKKRKSESQVPNSAPPVSGKKEKQGANKAGNATKSGGREVQGRSVQKGSSIGSISVADAAHNIAGGKNDNATYDVYVPSGSFVKGMLLTGLDAPTGAKAGSSPHPVLLRLQDLSFLPNEVQQNMMGCRVLGEGYGELSSERAYMRLVNLSCVERDTGRVLDMNVKGFVADSDGKIGLRGRVVSKQGMFLAQTLKAAFVEGIAEGFNTAQDTIVTTSEGTVSTPSIDNFGDGFKKGTASGLSEAAESLSEFYLDMAEEIFPIIEIGAKRHVTIVFTQPISGKLDQKYKEKKG